MPHLSFILCFIIIFAYVYFRIFFRSYSFGLYDISLLSYFFLILNFLFFLFLIVNLILFASDKKNYFSFIKSFFSKHFIAAYYFIFNFVIYQSIALKVVLFIAKFIVNKKYLAHYIYIFVFLLPKIFLVSAFCLDFHSKQIYFVILVSPVLLVLSFGQLFLFLLQDFSQFYVDYINKFVCYAEKKNHKFVNNETFNYKLFFKASIQNASLLNLVKAESVFNNLRYVLKLTNTIDFFKMKYTKFLDVFFYGIMLFLITKKLLFYFYSYLNTIDGFGLF